MAGVDGALDFEPAFNEDAEVGVDLEGVEDFEAVGVEGVASEEGRFILGALLSV